MKILFVNPSLRPTAPTKYLPVGIAYVMTVVKNGGHDFDLLDVDVHSLDNNAVIEYLKTHSYDVILTGSIVTHYKWIKWFVYEARKYNPKAKLIVGNSVAGSIPQVFLKDTPADIVVSGEGEYTTLDALNAIRDGRDLKTVLGITYRSETGEIIENDRRPACNINELPLIDWELFDIQKYFSITDSKDAAPAIGLAPPGGGKVWRTVPVSTARGCIHKCTFCHYVFWNDPYRHRSHENIIAEIRRNIEAYGANYVNFWDDLSFTSVGQAEKIVDAIIESQLKFYWIASVRSDLFGNPDISYDRRLAVARKFKEAGCVAVGYSLESGSQEILQMMNKKVKVEYFEEQMKLLNLVGIKSATSVVFGYPIETRETIKQTFDMCKKNRVYPSIGFLLPLPATGMYEHALKHGFIKDEAAYLESITERQDICLNMTTMSDEEILGAIKEGAAELNAMLELGLTEDRLIKTGGYQKHTKQSKDNPQPEFGGKIDPEKLKRIQNDVSFNYSQQNFDLTPGTARKAETC